jgi:hypothetical protein
LVLFVSGLPRLCWAPKWPILSLAALSLSLSLLTWDRQRRRHGFISSMGSSSDTSGGDKEKGSEPSFKEGDRVLAYHGPLLYEAKVGCPLSPPSIPSPKP